MPDALPLFPDAPEQAPDPQIRTDEHVLQPCGVCGGTGREVEWWGKWDTCDRTCLRCRGAGAILSRVGRWRDAN